MSATRLAELFLQSLEKEGGDIRDDEVAAKAVLNFEQFVAMDPSTEPVATMLTLGRSLEDDEKTLSAASMAYIRAYELHDAREVPQRPSDLVRFHWERVSIIETLTRARIRQLKWQAAAETAEAMCALLQYVVDFVEGVEAGQTNPPPNLPRHIMFSGPRDTDMFHGAIRSDATCVEEAQSAHALAAKAHYELAGAGSEKAMNHLKTAQRLKELAPKYKDHKIPSAASNGDPELFGEHHKKVVYREVKQFIFSEGKQKGTMTVDLRLDEHLFPGASSLMTSAAVNVRVKLDDRSLLVRVRFDGFKVEMHCADQKAHALKGDDAGAQVVEYWFAAGPLNREIVPNDTVVQLVRGKTVRLLLFMKDKKSGWYGGLLGHGARGGVAKAYADERTAKERAAYEEKEEGLKEIPRDGAADNLPSSFKAQPPPEPQAARAKPVPAPPRKKIEVLSSSDEEEIIPVRKVPKAPVPDASVAPSAAAPSTAAPSTAAPSKASTAASTAAPSKASTAAPSKDAPPAKPVRRTAERLEVGSAPASLRVVEAATSAPAHGGGPLVQELDETPAPLAEIRTSAAAPAAPPRDAKPKSSGNPKSGMLIEEVAESAPSGAAGAAGAAGARSAEIAESAAPAAAPAAVAPSGGALPVLPAELQGALLGALQSEQKPAKKSPAAQQAAPKRPAPPRAAAAVVEAAAADRKVAEPAADRKVAEPAADRKAAEPATPAQSAAPSSGVPAVRAAVGEPRRADKAGSARVLVPLAPGVTLEQASVECDERAGRVRVVVGAEARLFHWAAWGVTSTSEPSVSWSKKENALVLKWV